MAQMRLRVVCGLWETMVIFSPTMALSAAAEPMAAVRWIALGLALAVCVYHALRARQRKPEN